MAIAFATYDDLRRLTNRLPINEQVRIKTAASHADRSKSTFLSHSSKDSEYLPGVIKLLSDHGASVYCDLQDKRMPSIPNIQTADIIKDQIRSSKRLIIFVTTNSKDSKWVPWELGIGDATLSSKNVALLPTASTQNDQYWARQEYLGLYRHIVHGLLNGAREPVWLVYDYRTQKAETLINWLN